MGLLASSTINKIKHLRVLIRTRPHPKDAIRNLERYQLRYQNSTYGPRNFTHLNRPLEGYFFGHFWGGIGAVFVALWRLF